MPEGDQARVWQVPVTASTPNYYTSAQWLVTANGLETTHTDCSPTLICERICSASSSTYQLYTRGCPLNNPCHRGSDVHECCIAGDGFVEAGRDASESLQRMKATFD